MNKQWIAVITDESKRLRMQFLCVFLLLGVVAAGMTLMNILTHKATLAAVTGAFSLLCFADFALVKLSGGRQAGMTAASVLFMLELLAMFTYFIVSGTPDGFSCIWIAMLPSCGMLVFGRRRTTVLCAVIFCILAFFFWTAPGQALLQYDYNPTFKTRFPVLYVAFFALSFLLETIRAATQRELDRLREEYKYRAAHDYLTDMLNRQGLEEWEKTAETGPEQAVFMLDIDRFKAVNDSRGHDAGDLVLAAVAQETAYQAGRKVCRWGGEEFVVWFPDSREMTDPEALREAIARMPVTLPNGGEPLRVTVSIGVARGAGGLDTLIPAADAALYRAKELGRNRVEWAETPG